MMTDSTNIMSLRGWCLRLFSRLPRRRRRGFFVAGPARACLALFDLLLNTYKVSIAEVEMTGLRNVSFVALIALVPTLATAATPAPSASVRAACTPDARRLCGAVIGNPEAQRKCMIEHRAQLSDACKTAIAE